VAAAERAGLRAATINSSNVDDWGDVFEALSADRLDALLVSPERLGNPSFARQLPQLLARVGLIVIDEAHCISDWGFDFRPDYQRLARALLGAPGVAVLATTATANQRVTDDVGRQLGEHAVTLRGPLARSSLRLSVVPDLGPIGRYAWVADAIDTMPGSGIIYVLTVAETERLAAFLRERGHDVPAYSGQTDGDEKVRIEQQLRRNEIKAVVATSALGMGFDKPDLGFCIHVGSPGTPVAYYQQVGRAGRALDHAEAVLLPGSGDEAIWEYFATANIPDPDLAATVLGAIADQPLSVPSLESATGARRGRLDALLKILAVDGVVEKDGSAWRATGIEYQHDTAKWAVLTEVRGREADIMRRYAHGDGCLMAFLQTALDDPDPAPCGRCSVCTGELPVLPNGPSADAIEAARTFLRGRDIDIEIRKRWPSGVAHKGAVGGLVAGRAVAFADDPGWADELAALRRSGGRDLPPTLLEGSVAVLTRWRTEWPGRPVVVVPAPASGAEAEGNRRLAEHIGAVGRLPVVDCFRWNGASPSADAGSTAVVAALEAAVTLDPSVDQLSSAPDGLVLLCSATARTRWRLTLAGQMLLDATGRKSLALVIHQLP
jgi:ATP-dependent DNA helicase RecQ